jgi:hypothetical protein
MNSMDVYKPAMLFIAIILSAQNILFVKVTPRVWSTDPVRLNNIHLFAHPSAFKLSNKDPYCISYFVVFLQGRCYYINNRLLFVCFWRDSPPPQWAMASSFTRFLDHTQRRTTVGRTPLDEWSARRRDLYQGKYLPQENVAAGKD